MSLREPVRKHCTCASCIRYEFFDNRLKRSMNGRIVGVREFNAHLQLTSQRAAVAAAKAAQAPAPMTSSTTGSTVFSTEVIAPSYPLAPASVAVIPDRPTNPPDSTPPSVPVASATTASSKADRANPPPLPTSSRKSEKAQEKALASLERLRTTFNSQRRLDLSDDLVFVESLQISAQQPSPKDLELRPDVATNLQFIEYEQWVFDLLRGVDQVLPKDMGTSAVQEARSVLVRDLESEWTRLQGLKAHCWKSSREGGQHAAKAETPGERKPDLAATSIDNGRLALRLSVLGASAYCAR
ncbi:hypothetical protein FA95DRAFT_1284613 [Auriscalpium vulgare]|uniref:Uncharacterized protein n=1 Tax=Auriscalpium vulgare TaxID=40419 RepID=A0ACB8R222_9AGAM|nr:hypothetical protein FA95DRAFT_1284613 [Auriscalpium vulgare]